MGQTDNIIKQKTQKLANLQGIEGELTWVTMIQQELNSIVEQNDVQWRQRVKENWLKN